MSGNMQKITFFQFQLGMGYGVRKMTGHGASGTNFFDRQGLSASLTQTLKNEEPSRAPPENALAFYKFSFFLISGSFGFDFY